MAQFMKLYTVRFTTEVAVVADSPKLAALDARDLLSEASPEVESVREAQTPPCGWTRGHSIYVGDEDMTWQQAFDRYNNG